jgi:arsenite methyltransferase
MIIIATIHLSNGQDFHILLNMEGILDSVDHIREAVCQVYSEAARHPADDHPFPVGREFAESIGYPPEVLSNLPSVSIDGFAGVSDVAVFAAIPIGAKVLDLGCGAGLDSLIAATRTGPVGKVIGIDFSEAMLARARMAAKECGIENVEFRHADAENLPIPTGSIDVALVNGIFNLNPKRDAIFRELGRVVRDGGTVYAAELILQGPLPPETQTTTDDWFA